MPVNQQKLIIKSAINGMLVQEKDQGQDYRI